MGISQYVIIILSLTILLIPVSQVDAILILPEISDEEFSKNFIEIHELEMEKIRDYYFEVNRLQNPYHDKISDEDIILNDKEFRMSNSIYRHDENFQMLKNEQIDLAQKKYLEQLGGKSIISSLGDKPDKRIIPILEFGDEEKSIMKVIHRYDEGFKSYKIQQKILAENTINKLIRERLWEEDPFITSELFEDYYYSNSVKDVETISAAFDLIDDGIITAEELIETNVISPEDLIQDNVISADYLKLFWKTYEPVESTKTEVQETLVIPEEDDFDWEDIEWKNDTRSDQEFQNLIAEQILLAENTRSEELSLFPYANPYEEENDAIITQKIFVELEPILKREDEKFQEYKLEQIKKAELILKNLYPIKNLDEDEINNQLIIEKELVLSEVDDRSDMFFKLKEFEKDRAEKKILEIFGGKNIYN